MTRMAKLVLSSEKAAAIMLEVLERKRQLDHMGPMHARSIDLLRAELQSMFEDSASTSAETRNHLLNVAYLAVEAVLKLDEQSKTK